MLAVVFLLTFVSLSCAATHSLRYFYTASSGIGGLPEYISVGEVDGVVISYYDSSIGKEVPKQYWMAKNLDDQYWTSEAEVGKYHEVIFKENIDTLKQRFNQTGGVHVFQKMYGCQWDDETQAADGFEIFGYNGEDFLSLDPTKMTWLSPFPQANNTVYKWNRMENFMPRRKSYFQKDCTDWLKKYVMFGNSVLGRKVRPEVSLLQKGSEVACHATGFYPDAVMVIWKKDGVEMMDDVDVGETLPNEDGTFQKRAVLTISPEERKKAQYSCEVTHKSGEPRVLIFKEEEISFPIIGVISVVAFTVLVVVVAVMMMMKKKGYTKAPQSDTSSDNSSEPTKA